MSGSAVSTVGQANPFRYRGYYYDSETGYYYLNSRYYDPITGRFLNAAGDDPTLQKYNVEKALFTMRVTLTKANELALF